MDKRKTRISRIKSPKTSTPHEKSKRIPPLSNQISPDNQSSIDKNSFIKSLHLISSETSTDEEKTDSKEQMSSDEKLDSSLLSDDNILIEDFYWKGPFNNKPIHFQEGNQKKKAKSKLGIVSKSKPKPDTCFSINSKINSCETKSAPSIPSVKPDSKTKSKKTKKGSKNHEDVQIQIRESLMTSNKTTSRNGSPKKKTKPKQGQYSGRDSDHDEPRSDFTDNASDIEVVTVSKDGIVFSGSKGPRRNTNNSAVYRSPTSSEKKRKNPYLGIRSPSSSDKKRSLVKLYSFKEKFSEEVDGSIDNGNDDSVNIAETWVEIGDHLASIAQRITEDKPESDNEKKTKKGSNAKKSNKKTIKTKDCEENRSDLSKSNLKSQPASAAEQDVSSLNKSMDISPKSLIGKGCGTSGKKSIKKKLSEILPKPQRGRAKRKLIEVTSEEESNMESDLDISISSNKRSRTEIETENTRNLLEDNVNQSDMSKSTTKKNSSKKSRKPKRIYGAESSMEEPTDSIESEAEERGHDLNGSSKSSHSIDTHNQSVSQDEDRDAVVTSVTGNELGRSRRSRRSTVGLIDYVQPSIKVTPRKEAKKPRTPREPGVEQSCPRCQMKLVSLSYLKSHLMTVHQALWSKECPEGLTDYTSLGKIMKKLGKLNCPTCGKELRYMHYYKKHVEWCGREDERFFCSLCNKNIMVMWKHEHSLMHIRKDKMEQIDRRNAAILEQQEVVPQETPSTDRKRLSAIKAEKKLSAISRSYNGTMVDLTDESHDPDAKVDSESSDDDYVIMDDIDEEEKEEIKATRSGPDSKHMYTGSFFVNTFEMNLEHRKETDRYNNVQFPEFCPRVPEWDPLGESDVPSYLPTEKTSPEFCIKMPNKKQDIQDKLTLNLFNGTSSKESSILYAGGPVWGLAWCPQPYHTRNQSQYLAVSNHLDWDTVNPVTVTEGPGLIQIWNMGILKQCVQSLPVPKLEFCVAHDYGVVRQMTWCPYRCWQSEDQTMEEDQLRQLGLLAIACGDGSIRIFSIPDPLQLKKQDSSDPIVYRPTPEVTLVAHKIRRGDAMSCISLSWCGHDRNLLIGGYGDGSVRIWNLRTTSTILKIPTPDQGLLLLPYRSFIAHCKPVTDIHWSPHNSEYFVTTSIDRFVKLWHIDNLVMPQMSVKSSALTAAVWPSIVQSFIYADDDVYVPQRAHIRIHSYGDLWDKNRATNSPLQVFPTGIWDLSVSDWHSMVFGCDFHGNLVATYYPAVFADKKPTRTRMLLSKVRMKPKKSHTETQTNKVGPSSKKGQNEDRQKDCPVTETYRDTVNNYYLEFVENIAMDKKLVYDNVPDNDLKQFPLTSIHRVELNPNLESCMFVASGGQSGLVQIHNVTRCLAFHPARDLRQELQSKT